MYVHVRMCGCGLLYLYHVTITEYKGQLCTTTQRGNNKIMESRVNEMIHVVEVVMMIKQKKMYKTTVELEVQFLWQSMEIVNGIPGGHQPEQRLADVPDQCHAPYHSC